MKRILLAGPSGTGRTTIGDALSRELKIPFLKAKDITNPILKRDGYDYASGLQVERFLQTSPRQIEILTETSRQMDGLDQFITDRGYLDLAAYAMLGEESLDAETLDRILGVCHCGIKRYTHIFLFRPGELIDNSKRTLSRHYQSLVFMVELGLLTEWRLSYSVVDDYGMDTHLKLNDVRSLL